MIASGNETFLKSSVPRKLSPGDDEREPKKLQGSPHKKLKQSIRRSMGAAGTQSEMKNHSPESLTKTEKQDQVHYQGQINRNLSQKR